MLLEGMDREELLIFCAILFYSIWKGQCSYCFEGDINWFKFIGHFNVAVEEFLTIKTQDISPTMSSSSLKWSPQRGFIKVNMDAAFVASQAAVAMVVRNDQGHLLYLASKLMKCVSSFVAEVEALRWAAKYAKQQDGEVKWRRSNNLATNATANLALSSNHVFTFDEFSIGLIPSCILDVIIAEQAAALV
ncbi:hypothetical protein FNV43_RR01707 [Rhamnella rubrinervis]|uniref:RNase H type-1 domain-containing protein n=1 Tax=Rhamnella rubrinervis TaxID=2594499 RepID=A0A8K0HSP3_9ROSA|nr:hypothetical protein FNV43_RR01707 [Rhamnella rubrinervis]